MEFYSARLLVIILVDDGRPRRTHDYDDSVVVFRARSFDHAFKRALELGRGQEVTYKNHLGHKVRWALVSVEVLDRVGRIIDGKEVSSHIRRRTVPTAISPRARFRPENSKPGQSI